MFLSGNRQTVVHIVSSFVAAHSIDRDMRSVNADIPEKHSCLRVLLGAFRIMCKLGSEGSKYRGGRWDKPEFCEKTEVIFNILDYQKEKIYGTDPRTNRLYRNVHGRNFALCSNCWSLIIEKSSGVVRYTRIRITAPHRRGPVGTSSARDTFFSTNDLIMNGDRRKILVLLIDIFV